VRLGFIKSITFTRSPPRMRIACTGGIPDEVLCFKTEAEVLGKYDELVEIEEQEKNAQPS
jgi:hypothetical protein